MRTIRRQVKAQPAIEFLMNYMWAIIIISLSLFALYSLGVFQAFSFSAKASPGSCSVYRPQGPFSTSLVSVQGDCHGELPQYVAQFAGGTYEGGSGSYINLGTAVSNIANKISVSGWVYTTNSPDYYQYLISNDRDCCGSYKGYSLFVNTGTPEFQMWSPSGAQYRVAGPVLKPNAWYFMTGTYDGSTVSLYVNGAFANSAGYSGTIGVPSSYNTEIGALGSAPSSYGLQGDLANIQVYNTSLSAAEVNALYLEGIGGAPLVLQNLVGWWPLNGDAKDYSGNANDGTAHSLAYNSKWTGGYTPP